MTSGPNLATYAWLSIAAAIATIALKAGAWLLTGSVGLLSDAAESVVNLVAACVALGVLRVAARPADEGHMFGHTKAEFFSAAVEGVMIFVAAVAIMVSAVQRFIHPAPLDNVGIGLGISVVASLINGAVGWLLLRAGRQHRSLTLVADGKHLLTDVVTSAGVLVGVGLVWLTGWKLVTESTDGLMDSTLSAEENASIVSVLAGRTNDEVVFHGLRTRHAGRQLFATFHALVPGDWSVTRAHDLIEEIEQEIQQALPGIELEIHLEPREDPRAYNDHPVEIPIRPAEPPYAAGPPSR